TRLDETAQKLAADMPKELPIGAIHCDLFVDNTLFLGDRLSGVIDFYQACTDYYALDLAILINDWCFDSDNRLDEMRVESILQRYHSERALTSTETQHLG
ncbi:MAG: phosphotransferase, partial [bacterium]